MNRLAIIILISFTAITSCQEDDPGFIPIEKSYTEPEVELENFAAQLLSADNGWIGVLEPAKGGVYHFYLDLGEDNLVTMFSEFNRALARQTPYNIQLDDRSVPTLTIEHGSSLDLLGKTTDKQFTMDHYDSDQLVLTGNKLGDKLVLHKATTEEKQQHFTGTFSTLYALMFNYLQTAPFFFAETGSGELLHFQFSLGARGAVAIYVDGQAVIRGSDFSFTHRGIRFKNPVVVRGISIEEIFWDSTAGTLYFENNGTRTDIFTTSVPVIPLHYLLGTEIEIITLPNPAVYPPLPSWSIQFRQLWLVDENQLLQQTGLKLLFLDFQMRPDETLTIQLWCADNGSLVVVDLPYKYSKTQEGIYDFEAMPIDTSSSQGQNASLIRSHLSEIFGVIEHHQFSIEFFDVPGIFPPVLLGKFSSINDEEIFFTGVFN